MDIQPFSDATELAQALAQSVAVRVQSLVESKGQAVLALSGGRTPVRFLQELSRQSIDWAKVIVTLVDERWVAPDHPQSNERLLREHLWQNQAQQAYFLPLKNAALHVLDGYQESENRLCEMLPKIDIAVLGMGEDGHCASWFPQSQALAGLLSEQTQARSLPVVDAPEVAERLSLTWAFLAQSQHLYVHFEGAKKKAVFDHAQLEQERHQVAVMPIRKLLVQKTVPVSLYYCL